MLSRPSVYTGEAIQGTYQWGKDETDRKCPGLSKTMIDTCPVHYGIGREVMIALAVPHKMAAKMTFIFPPAVSGITTPLNNNLAYSLHRKMILQGLNFGLPRKPKLFNQHLFICVHFFYKCHKILCIFWNC